MTLFLLHNLDTVIDCREASEEEEMEKTNVEKGTGKRRHSMAATLNFLHLN